jgi:hypothetical protein
MSEHLPIAGEKKDVAPDKYCIDCKWIKKGIFTPLDLATCKKYPKTDRELYLKPPTIYYRLAAYARYYDCKGMGWESK